MVTHDYWFRLRTLYSKVVAAWGRANPSSTRSTRVVNDLDKPALRSTRNALGVLAGGGEADLADDHGSAEVNYRSLKLSYHMIVWRWCILS